MQLNVTAASIEGKTITLDNILKLEASASINTPADSLKAVFLCDKKMPCLYSIGVRGAISFDGIVDRQVTSKNENGVVLTLEAHSRGALLIDNEALPQLYSNAAVSDIFDRTIRPYGYQKLIMPGNPRLPAYIVRKGTSEWEAFYSFCMRAAGLKPYICGDNVVLKSPVPAAYTSISNITDYTSLTAVYSPCKVISKVCIRDNNGYYSSAVKNGEADMLKIRRKRYIIPPTEFVKSPQFDANQIIKASMLEYLQISVVLPYIKEFNIGDFVSVDDIVSADSFTITETAYTADENGFSTKLTLRDGRYI